MSFSGQIEDFPVIDIMQYIHASRKSGTLSFQKGNDIANICLKDGHIIRAMRPEMTNIGVLLLKLNKINKEDIDAAIRVQKSLRNPRPLGMILEEMGVITHHVLRDAIIRQIEEVIYEIVTWGEGSFHFKLENHEFLDDITVTPDDLIPPEEIDTQFLLLEAMRIFDETKHRAELAREIFDNDIQELSQASEELKENQIEDDPSPSNDTTDIAKIFPLLKEMLLEVRKNGQTQSISVYFLKILSEHLDRAILFLVRRGELLGLVAFGNTTSNLPMNSEIRNLRVPFGNGSLLNSCIEKRSSFVGIPLYQDWLEKIQKKIGEPANSEVMLLPIAGIERVMCLVYGDNGHSRKNIRNLELLEIVAGQTGIILENNFLRKQIQRNPS